MNREIEIKQAFFMFILGKTYAVGDGDFIKLHRWPEWVLMRTQSRPTYL